MYTVSGVIMYPKEILNKIKWTGNPTLTGITIIYVSRGAYNDEAKITGKDILEMDTSFMTFKRKKDKMPTTIPYHRIKKIIYDKDVIWSSDKYDRREC